MAAARLREMLKPEAVLEVVLAAARQKAATWDDGPVQVATEYANMSRGELLEVRKERGVQFSSEKS